MHAVACYQAASPALVRLLSDDMLARYGTDLPSAVACFADDFDASSPTSDSRLPCGPHDQSRSSAPASQCGIGDDGHFLLAAGDIISNNGILLVVVIRRSWMPIKGVSLMWTPLAAPVAG
jgi:hypothetical protein